MVSSGKSKPNYKTALSILDTFGPATAMHYLLLQQLHAEVRHDGLPQEFLDIMKKIDESADASENKQTGRRSME